MTGEIPVPTILERPFSVQWTRGRLVDTAIVHSMGERIVDRQGVLGRKEAVYEAWDWLEGLELGVHALIRPDGVILAGCDTALGTYHAKGWNRQSFGAEFLVLGTHDYGSFLAAIGAAPGTGQAVDPYTEAQYSSGGWWYAHKCRRHKLARDTILSHQRADPARKHDPGPAFSWRRFWHWYDICWAAEV